MFKILKKLNTWGLGFVCNKARKSIMDWGLERPLLRSETAERTNSVLGFMAWVHNAANWSTGFTAAIFCCQTVHYITVLSQYGIMVFYSALPSKPERTRAGAASAWTQAAQRLSRNENCRFRLALGAKWRHLPRRGNTWPALFWRLCVEQVVLLRSWSNNLQLLSKASRLTLDSA